MGVGVNKLLTRLAERLATLVLVTLVPEQIYVLVAVLTLEVILADLFDYMLLVTMLAAKHSATVFAKRSSVRHTLFVGEMAFRTHAGTIMVFFVVIAFLTNFAVVAAAKISRHCADQVVVVFA